MGNGLTDPEIQYQYYAKMANSTNDHKPLAAKTVEGMQELWDTFYPASGMRDRPAPRFPSETSNRVDGLNLETVTHATPPANKNHYVFRLYRSFTSILRG